ncbi:MAG TPA: hypothetical protein VHT52_04135 [Stellaceae bacterium]|nr:hypothetical protein [Stellaceae bacterium]
MKHCRLLEERDIPWMLDLAKRRYGDDGTYDYVGAEQWFRNIALKGPMVFLPIRMSGSFLIAMVSCLPWMPNNFECNIVWVVADDGCMWQALALLKVSVEWARRRRCTEWRVASETEHEMGALAKRLGALEITPRYKLRLD